MDLMTLTLVDARNLGTDGLCPLWEQLEREGSARSLFYDGSMNTAEDFARFAQAPQRLLYAVFVSGTPAALFWLDGWSGRAAFIHFVVFRRAYGSTARVIGRYVTGWLLRAKRKGGLPLVQTLIGLTPETNPLAIRFVRDIGFRVLGRIPHAVTMLEGETTGAIVSILTHEEV
ncbi:hypothetical protein [Desulfovibrio ferrophilus]|uniref:N-acetyltransferase domain-containing protein n=1 Tax=Desulfovibrio ferrophilus TaxID=241368 RepID=A0A2Z6AZQ9_9BACT|nr:hypothetical protein [Desulfovibrio ferrophilus]BBD08757.1 uncharacterized protein DFE_2031 [Desulfovibrio ferrophilus]